MHIKSPVPRVGDRGKSFQQAVGRNVEYFSKCGKFNIGYKTLPRFNSLDGVFVNVNSRKLQLVRKFSLGKLRRIGKP